MAVLGGGVGAMSAAFELSRGDWRQRFESITVYQVGWRLGGKGASGRGRFGRIEEHGLHVWFGSYENAFRIMRECYDELSGTPGQLFASVDDAFERASIFALEEIRPEGWIPWVAEFPEDEQRPGDPTDPTPLPSLWEYLLRSLELSLTVLSSVVPHDPDAEPEAVSLRAVTEAPVVLLAAPASAIAAAGATGVATPALLPGIAAAHAALAEVLQFAEDLGLDVPSHTEEQHRRLADLIGSVLGLMKRLLREPAHHTDATRRLWYVGDIFLAIALGMLRSGALTHSDGLDVIDGFDFTDWLILNGADEESARCALVRTVCYDLPFAYREGDPAQPSCSAACALQGVFRLFFTYRGAVAWKMRAGMGDIVFAPLYKVLHDRGVQFRFFHKVEALHLSDDKRRVESIDICRQVRLAGGRADYEPLVLVKGLDCWPSRPRWEQLRGGRRLRDSGEDLESFWNRRADGGRITLQRGTDFDEVVLGISIGALPFLCAELIDEDPAWARMVAAIGTVRTQALQLWLSEPMEQLAPGLDYPFTLGGYVEPFDTYADMRQIIEQEDYPPGHPVRAIAYFCNTMPTPESPDPSRARTPAEAEAEVLENVRRFLRQDMVPLWPSAVRRYPSDFRWEVLVDPDGRQGQYRLQAQYWRANVNPSDLYVLSLPGSARWRLDPFDSHFDNLTLAGDWTSCGLNVGCVEAATISGRLAAFGVQGWPEPDSIVGYRQER